MGKRKKCFWMVVSKPGQWPARAHRELLSVFAPGGSRPLLLMVTFSSLLFLFFKNSGVIIICSYDNFKYDALSICVFGTPAKWWRTVDSFNLSSVTWRAGERLSFGVEYKHSNIFMVASSHFFRKTWQYCPSYSCLTTALSFSSASLAMRNFEQPGQLQLQCQMALSKGVVVVPCRRGLDPFNRTTGIFAGKSDKNTFHPAAPGSQSIGCLAQWRPRQYPKRHACWDAASLGLELVKLSHWRIQIPCCL